MATRRAARKARRDKPEARREGPGKGGMPADPVATIRRAARVFRMWGQYEIVAAMAAIAAKHVPGATL